MARYQRRDGIGSDGRADGARGRRRANPAGDIAVGDQRARRDGQKSRPDLDLKVRALAPQPQRPARLAAVRLDYGLARLAGFVLRDLEPRGGKVAANPRQRRFRSLGTEELQSANAAVGRRDDEVAEQSRMHAVAHFESFSHRLVFSRRDSFEVDEQVVQAGWAGQPGVAGSLERASGAVKDRFCVRERQIAEKLFGTDSGPSREQALEVIGAQGRRVRGLVERRLLAEVLAEVAEGAFDSRVIQRQLRSGLFRHFRRP